VHWIAAARVGLFTRQGSVRKRTARAGKTAYASGMGLRQISAPACPRCSGTALRNTRPSPSGCFRICKDCNHMWHVTGEALRAENAVRGSGKRARQYDISANLQFREE